MTYIHNRGFPGGNPIANALVIIAGTLIIAASVVIGFFAIVIVGAAFLVLAAVVGIRLWWMRRKLRREGRWPPDGVDAAAPIEGEYTVILQEQRSRKDPGA